MGSGRALAVSGLASAALHALPLLLLVEAPRLRWPEAPIPIEVRPAHRPVEKQGPPQAGDPRSTEKPRPPAPRPHPARKAAGIAKPAPAPPPPATADLRPFAPGDARIVVLLRTDRLRKSPHKESVQALLEALPDYHTLLAGTGLTPVDDFDALLIATANPYDVTATFLAARHPDDNRLRAALERRTMPGWDPRVIRHLGPRLSVLTRPEGAARLDGTADGGVDDRAQWLADLGRFERAADEPGGPSMLVTVSDFASLAQLGGGLPTPQAAAIAATADPSPSVRLRLVFADEAEAERFRAEWPDIVARWRSSTMLFGLGGMLDGLAVQRAGADVEVLGRVPEREMRIALSWAKALIPRPPAPVDAPTDGGTHD